MSHRPDKAPGRGPEANDRAPTTQFPLIRAEVGDTIKITFRNNVSFPVTLHPHGVFYEKDSEGAPYNDGTTGTDRDDDGVPTDMVPDDPGTRLYHCHVNDHIHAGMMALFTVNPRGAAVMLLNRIEKALMNNPARARVQRWYETALLGKLGTRTDGLRVLQIGCGRGVGTEIILDRFGAREVHAFDLDPDMVALAGERLARYPPERVQFRTGDVTAIQEPDASFDAVFDFGIAARSPWPNGNTC